MHDDQEDLEEYSFLLQEVKDLSERVMDQKPILWENSKLMEIYTFVYKKCIDDFSTNKNVNHLLYRLHEKSVDDFVNELSDRLLQLFKPSVEEIIVYSELFSFFCSNLNFAFRYLNKFFVLKFKMMTLEEQCRDIFLRKMWPWMEKRCSDQLQRYTGNEKEIKQCAQLFHYMNREKLRMNRCISSLMEGYRGYFSSIFPLPAGAELSLDKVMSLYHHQELHILEVSEKLAIPTLRKDLFSVMVDCFQIPSVTFLVREHASSVILHARYEVMMVLVLISKEAFLESIHNNIVQLYPHPNVFPLIKRYHDHLKALEVQLQREGHNELGEEIYRQFCLAVSALFQGFPSLYTLFARLVESDPCNFLFIVGILERKEDFILYYGKLFYSRLIGMQGVVPMIPMEEMRKYIHPPLLYKLENLVNDSRGSLALTRAFSSTVATNTASSVRCNLFVFSEKMFMRNSQLKLVHLEGIPCPILRESGQNILAFYKSQHPMRTFSFHLWESLVFLEATFSSSSSYCFRMSVMQYLVLRYGFMDSSSTSKTWKDLRERCASFLTGNDSLRAVLHSFCRRNPPLVFKTGDPKRLCPEKDHFTLNMRFESKTKDHSWELPRFRGSEEEEGGGAPSVVTNMDTGYVVRARVVRLCKRAPQTMNDLLREMIDLTRDPVLIQTQLEYLIKQEYIELEEITPETKYVYLP